MRVYEKISSLKEKLQKLKQNIKSRQKGQTFHFSPFSRKQKQVLTWWCKDSPVHDKDGIIADGAIRSGKTVSMSLSFVMWAMSTFNGQNFAMCGKTIGSFRRNVLFWLKLMLRRYEHIVWLNPYSRPIGGFFGEWGETYDQISSMFDMYHLTVAGLEAAMKKLMVKN